MIFTRKPVTREDLRAMLAAKEAIAWAANAADEDHQVRMATVYIYALRRLIARLDAGEPLAPSTELQGFRIGPLAFLGTPFEVFQAIKNDVVAGARAPIPLVMGLTNDELGYAPDRTCATRGGYASEQVPYMLGSLPFTAIHEELAGALLSLDGELTRMLPDAIRR
ncbi:MAG: hypothetical protein BWY76_00176 [bacterium ADurb.Bin429]|nr:MAG: hypothetical protein BWY76_00176 [bacterium ADurb.Bin429]